MFSILRSPSRHALSVGLATLLAGALALSGCSSSPTVAKATPAASTTKAVVTPPPFTVHGVPAALAVIIKTVHFGGSAPSSPTAVGAVRQRKPVKGAARVVASGVVASFKGLLIMAAAGLTKLEGPAKLPGIPLVAAPDITTSLSAQQVLTFAAGVFVTSYRKVHNRAAIGGFGMTSDGQSIVLLDANARRMFADIRDGNLL